MAGASWQGEGWYRIAYSDGGQDFTNDGPIWVETPLGLAEEIEAAGDGASETHKPYAEYLGDGDSPEE